MQVPLQRSAGVCQTRGGRATSSSILALAALLSINPVLLWYTVATVMLKYVGNGRSSGTVQPRSHPWVNSTTNSQRAGQIYWVFLVTSLGASCLLPLPIIQGKRHNKVAATAVNVDSMRTSGPWHSSQQAVAKQLLRLLPPILYQQGASPLQEPGRVWARTQSSSAKWTD